LRFSREILPIGGRDNDWLRLTGDDQRQSEFDGVVAMRRLFLAAMMFGAASGAEAADLPFLRGSFTDGLTTSRAYWQGYYVGGQISYGSADSKLPSGVNADMQATFLPPVGQTYNWLPLGQAHTLNGGYGVFAGYNSQWEDVVVGLEANYIHGGFRGYSSSTGNTYNPDLSIATTTYSNAVVKNSDFGSLRIRAGYIMGCFLPYAYLGAGFGSQTIERSVSAVPGPQLPPWTADSKTKLVYGYSAGLGVDVMLVGGLFARAEYEYQRVTSNIETNINTVRLGVGYKF
jgi:opacity protein-like surface antigen